MAILSNGAFQHSKHKYMLFTTDIWIFDNRQMQPRDVDAVLDVQREEAAPQGIGRRSKGGGNETEAPRRGASAIPPDVWVDPDTQSTDVLHRFY